MNRKTFFTAAGILAVLMAAAFPFDHAVAGFFHDHFPPHLIPATRFITTLGESQYILVPALLLMAALRKAQASKPFIAARNSFACVAATGILVQIPKYLFGRARPKALWNSGLDGFYGITWDSSLTAFPSGHTATAVAFALALSAIFPKARAPLFLYACFVAASRIVLLQHYPSDVIGASLVAFLVTIPLAKRLSSRV